ncbi:MAG: twin-arginine translocation signal domain-containing protein [Acidobacteria bacterium]|nr:twin-arginine translocation signal domain-containing protein [Acidobacteriota bacterium]
MGSGEKKDFGFGNSGWSRRRFMRDAALGGGAVLLASQGQALAQVLGQAQGRRQGRPGQPRPAPNGGAAAARQAARVSASEAKLHSLAARDPALHAVLADALHYAKYSVALAAAGVAGGGGNKLFADARAFLATRKPKARAAYESNFKALLSDPPPRRRAEFGRFAEVAPAEFASRDHRSLVKQVQPVRAQQMPRIINVELLRQAGYAHVDPEESEAGKLGAAIERRAEEQRRQQQAEQRREHQQDLAAGAQFKHIQFLIQRMRCLEQSGGTFEGSNEIALGGVAVGATGVVHKIKLPFHLEGVHTGGNFELPPQNQLFFTFDVAGEGFPRDYVATVLMTELDDGGFGDFLKSLWEDVSDFVTSALADIVVGTSVGQAIGSIIPGFGTIIGAVIGAIIGWLVDLFHNEDDMVGTQTATLEMHGAGKSNFDREGLDSPQGIPLTLDFHDDGHFQLDCAFRAVRA